MSKENMINKENKNNGLDVLTSLPNRGTLIEEIHESINDGLVKIIEGEEASHSFILLDVDYFKSINDIFSHNQGDEVLKSIGDILQECNSKEAQSILIGRWGGEEFLMVVPYDAKKTGERIAEEIRSKIAAHKFPSIKGIQDFNGKVTVSMGIRSYNLLDLANEVKSRNDQNDPTSKKSQDVIRKEINYLIGKALDSADSALNYAKFMGRNQIQVLSDFVEHEVGNISNVRRLYFQKSILKPSKLNNFFKDDYLCENKDVAAKIKKHFYIVRTEIYPKDTRTQAVFADGLYRFIISSRFGADRNEFLRFVKTYL